MADQGTRVRAGLVGQSTGFKLLRVNLAVEEAAIRAEFLTKAVEKLGVSLPADVGIVRLFLADSAPLDEMSMLEKDDTVWEGVRMPNSQNQPSFFQRSPSRPRPGCKTSRSVPISK